MILVKAGAPVDATISQLVPLLDKGDIIIDGGNEWYENTEARKEKVAEHGLLYMGMGVSGGEEGARNGEPRDCLQTPASAVPAAACQATMASWACITECLSSRPRRWSTTSCPRNGGGRGFVCGEKEGKGAAQLGAQVYLHQLSRCCGASSSSSAPLVMWASVHGPCPGATS